MSASSRHCRLVSIHAPAWGATATDSAFFLAVEMFQSTHPRGVRRSAPVTVQTGSRFNPRTRVGCDRCFCCPAPPVGCFNPRTRVGCDAPGAAVVRWGMSGFQSTHPRGVRRMMWGSRWSLLHVSIHAPAWGATTLCRNSACLQECFNPRTRVGCDAASAKSAGPNACFNPRTRVGCDPVLAKTSKSCPCFNPRTRVGCDRGLSGLVGARSSFNPRTRVGCDRCCRTAPTAACLFQSTHPRGVRRMTMPSCKVLPSVSIHAPAWGATQPGSRHVPARNRFNPRTRVGCDGAYRDWWAQDRVSIHAPAWGATPFTGYTGQAILVFQSTHPRGVRLAGPLRIRPSI